MDTNDILHLALRALDYKAHGLSKHEIEKAISSLPRTTETGDPHMATSRRGLIRNIPPEEREAKHWVQAVFLQPLHMDDMQTFPVEKITPDLAAMMMREQPALTVSFNGYDLQRINHTLMNQLMSGSVRAQQEFEAQVERDYQSALRQH